MKKMTLAVTALALVLGPALSWAANENMGGQPGTTPSASPSGNTNQPASDPSMNAAPAGSQAAQLPPADWTTLSGMVQSVDEAAKTVQIKDDSGQVLQVPVDRKVKIEKDGKNIRFSQIQTGDNIKLSKKPSSTTSESGASKNY